MKTEHKTKKVLLLTGIAIIIAMLVFIVSLFIPQKQTNSESEAVIQAMEEVVPYFGTGSEFSSGEAAGPLSVMSINGIDIVGALEIPSLDLRAPVTDKGVKKKYFARWAGGSPSKGKMRIMGGGDDVFSRIAKGKPGEKVIFTDVNGVRYDYTITTQFHLKDWAEADNDLMLCYKVDSDTKFVLGCTKAE